METNEKEFVKTQLEAFSNVMRQMFPEDCDIYIRIGKDYMNIDATKWEAPDENGKFDKTKRRRYLDISKFGTEWGSDNSEMMNDIFKAGGVLL